MGSLQKYWDLFGALQKYWDLFLKIDLKIKKVNTIFNVESSDINKNEDVCLKRDFNG